MSNWEVSKFLKYQDKNNDGLPDVCTPQKPIQTPKCPSCLPKPTALVPRWRPRSKNDPFLNERRCVYQITYPTPHTDTGVYEKYGANATEEQAEIVLKERADAFKDNAAEALAEYYNKDTSETSIKKLVDDMEWSDWDLDARPMSHLKFLYSVPHDTLEELPEAPYNDEEPEPDTDDIEVTFFASKLIKNMVRLRRALDFYSSNLKVYRALEGKNLFFIKGGVFNLDLYGDSAPFGNSVTERLIPELSKFLERYDIFLHPFPMFFNMQWDVATKIDFTFTYEYELKKMKVHTQGDCAPKIFGKSKLSRMLVKLGWNDPTAVAYFVRQNEILRDASARAPKPWLDTVINYTYPPIKSVKVADPIKLSDRSDAGDGERTIMGCIGDALEAEFKQLGQDIKDDIFDMGDALAAQFHKSLCIGDYVELLEEEFKIGKIDDPGANPNLSREEREKNIFQYAQEQAFGEIKDKDILFAGICARFNSMAGFPGGEFASQQNTLDRIWRDGLDPAMLCYLMDMFLDVIECLFSGLTFEELIASAVRSALRAMSIEDFGFLFIGLPPDKQARLDAMVKQKLASGDILREGSPGQRLSDSIETRNRDGSSSVPHGQPLFAKKIVIEKPWDNKEVVEEQKRNYMREGPLSGFSPTGRPNRGQGESQLSRATAAQQLKGIGDDLNPNVVMEAYISLLIEEYSDNLTDLIKLLDDLPGAPIIKYLIATLDCPRPPLFNPTLADFLGDLALPFCQGKWHIGLPRMDNLFAWIPKLDDFLAFLWWLAKKILQQLLIIIIMRLMIWLCQLLSDALCKALEIVGSAVANALTGSPKTLHEVIKDAICGPDSDPAQIEETIQGIFQSFGDGSAAFSDKQKVTNFVEDLSSAVTRKELTDAVSGDASSTFLNVLESLVEFEYPEFASTFGNRAKAEAFFENIGKLMPLEARDELNKFRGMLEDDDMMPANPSLCATPEQVEEFCANRAQLLAGRASPNQIQRLCDSGRDTLKEELQDIGDIFQKGVPAWLEDNMPPIMSTDPTCDDGVLPYEPPVLRESVTSTSKAAFASIEAAFYRDMMGEGNKRAHQWGWLNMVLSDTMGRPYSYHSDVTAFSSIFGFTRDVDYYIPYTPNDPPTERSAWAGHEDQYGAYPKTIAKQLQGEFQQLPDNHDFRATRDVADTEIFYQNYEELGFIRKGKTSGGWFGIGAQEYTDVDVELTILPDHGYNVKPIVEWDAQRVKFMKYARKRTPDLSLSYRDGGFFGTPDTVNDHNIFTYGFDIELFTNDIRKEDGQFYWRPGDTSRMVVHKTTAPSLASMGDSFFIAGEHESEGRDDSPSHSITWQEYEFIAKDNELDNNPLVGTGYYMDFDKALIEPVEASLLPPQLVLMSEMVRKGGLGQSMFGGTIESVYNDTMNKIWKALSSEVANNEPAFRYGAAADSITKSQIDYGFEENGQFLTVWEYVMKRLSEDSDWKMREMPLGISRMQWDEENNDGPENRVFYLDPKDYGGKNVNPPFYIKSPPASGWLGMAQALYPEHSACEPGSRPFVDFEEIKDSIDTSYSKIAEDKRLQKNPSCVSEKPYNRILHRAPKSTIEAVIKAACRVFGSMEMIKAYPVISKFAPDFKENYSNLFASYVVEVMEEGLKDAQNDIMELFTSFKDDEFWYAFLEQAVQTYARLIETGDIREPSDEIIAALERMENFEMRYKMPTKNDFNIAKLIGDTSRKESFKNYRYEKVLEGVQATEDDAKIILTEFVSIELDSLGVAFEKSLTTAKMEGIDSMYRNVGYYVLQNLSSNTQLDLHKTISEEPIGFPEEETSGLYTSGGELIYPDGNSYVGYYHVHRNEENKIIFMEGEEHTDTDHEVLEPLANRVKLPIGGIGSFAAVSDTSKPFIAETYMLINNEEYSVEAGMAKLRSNPADATKNISEVYPGTMKLTTAPVTDADGRTTEQVVGIEGELGVRYGLRFSLVMDTRKRILLRTEVDALDIPIGRIQPLEYDSKLMYCLVNNLIDEPAFQLLFKYVFPIPKFISSLAIYSAMGFLPSIGEIQRNTINADIAEKPGMSVETSTDENDQIVYSLVDGADGWAQKWQRYPGFARGYGKHLLHFDNWDRSELYYTKSKIKAMFKTNYFHRKFDPSKPAGSGGLGIGKLNKPHHLQNYKSMFVSNAALRHISWHKRKMLRSNPFNANGDICKKE